VHGGTVCDVPLDLSSDQSEGARHPLRAQVPVTAAGLLPPPVRCRPPIGPVDRGEPQPGPISVTFLVTPSHTDTSHFSWSHAGGYQTDRGTHMDKLLLRPIEAAEILGMGRSRLYALLKDGTIPCIRIGGSVRISVSALQEWVERLSEGSSAAPGRQ